MDEIQHGKPFFRDNSRKAPHNLYSTGRKLFDEACASYPMILKNTPVYIYRGSKDKLNSPKAEYVSIRYHGDYSLTIKYENGKYRRYMNDDLHIDKKTEKPLEASAVILQTANMKVVDSVGRQEISFIGSGKAKILEKGKITEVTWYKETPKGITKYKDNNGNDYIFPAKGQIWIQVVSPTHKIEIK